MVTAYSYDPLYRLSTVTQNSLPNTPASADVNVVTHYTYDAAGNMTDGAIRLLDMTDRLLKDLAHRDDDHRAAPKAEVVARAIAALRAEVTAQQTSGAIAHDHVATSLLGRLFLADAANQRTIRIVEAQTYIYDANGNRVNRVRLGHGESDIQGVDYAYDAENRLVTAQDYYGNARGDRANGGITSMAYDGEGRRLVKTYEAHQDDDGDERGDDGRTRVQTTDDAHEESDQTRVEYVFDELLPIAEYPITHERPDTRSDKSRDDSHATPAETVHTNYYRGDMGRILEQATFGGEDKGQTSWYHYDGLGSVSTLTQRSGERSTTYNYASYGQPKSQGSDSGKAGTHYTFTGQSWDSTTGLYEFYARPYDPATGTWLTQDPYRGQVSQPATLHRYGYVGGNPVNYVDWMGFVAEMSEADKKIADKKIYDELQNQISADVDNLKKVWKDEQIQCVIWVTQRRQSLGSKERLAPIGNNTASIAIYKQHYVGTTLIDGSLETQITPGDAIVTDGHIVVVERVEDARVWISESNYPTGSGPRVNPTPITTEKLYDDNQAGNNFIISLDEERYDDKEPNMFKFASYFVLEYYLKTISSFGDFGQSP